MDYFKLKINNCFKKNHAIQEKTRKMISILEKTRIT